MPQYSALHTTPTLLAVHIQVLARGDVHLPVGHPNVLVVLGEDGLVRGSFDIPFLPHHCLDVVLNLPAPELLDVDPVDMHPAFVVLAVVGPHVAHDVPRDGILMVLLVLWVVALGNRGERGRPNEHSAVKGDQPSRDGRHEEVEVTVVFKLQPHPVSGYGGELVTTLREVHIASGLNYN